MRERKPLFETGVAGQDINLSPLIDIVFILLIFFIVTTAFVEETGVEIARPKATSSAMLDKNAILIAITDEGKVVYGDREIGVNGVRGTVRRLMRKERRPVVIQADKSVSVETYTRVHDEALSGGADRIHLATWK